MSKLEQAQKELEKVGQQLKAEAKKIHETASHRLTSGSMASHRTIDYSYPSWIFHLRATHLFGLVLQAFTLYLWSRELSLSAFLIPFAMLCFNFYLVCKRFWYSVDGRYDFQRLLQVDNNQLRLHYFIAIYGSFLLALLVHFTGPELAGGFTAWLYDLSNYLSISCAFCIMGVDSVEGYKAKYQ